MIRILCFSAEDELRLVTWPEWLDIRPHVGERILSVNRKHSRRIISIEHVFVPRTTVREAYSYLGVELGRNI